MKRTPPVLAQDARLEAHLAAAAGEDRRAVGAWDRARGWPATVPWRSRRR
jgi:hypothetical protein